MQMEVKYTERGVGRGYMYNRGGGGARGGQRQRETVEEMAGGKQVPKKKRAVALKLWKRPERSDRVRRLSLREGA